MGVDPVRAPEGLQLDKLPIYLDLEEITCRTFYAPKSQLSYFKSYIYIRVYVEYPNMQYLKIQLRTELFIFLNTVLFVMLRVFNVKINFSDFLGSSTVFLLT